jgi:hypothetical protein
MENNKQYAVLTGASQGFGKAMAFDLARRKFNLILVALPNEGLDILSVELQKTGVDVVYYEVDLTDKGKLLTFTEWVNDNYNINMLVNNAGVGGTKNLLESSVDYLDTIIKLNITATTVLVHQLLPNLLRQNNRTYILNVSSMAAFCPIPYKTAYPASKRFVHDFSRGLHQELKKTNVFVSVVHPGPMRTNENVTNRIKHQGFWGALGVLSPEKAAALTLNQLFRHNASILPGKYNYFLWVLLTMLPVRIKFYLLTKSFKKQAQYDPGYAGSLSN